MLLEALNASIKETESRNPMLGGGESGEAESGYRPSVLRSSEATTILTPGGSIKLSSRKRPKRFELSTFSLGIGSEGDGACEGDSDQPGVSEDEQAGCDDSGCSCCDRNEDT